MQRTATALAVAALLLVSGAVALAHDPITWSTLDGGGVSGSAGGTWTLSGTIGQYDAGRMGSGTSGLSGGFWIGTAFAPPPAITIEDRIVFEGDGGTTPATFTVSLSSPAVSTVTVQWTTADLFATTADNDYLAVSGTVTFDPGETSQPVVVSVNGDTDLEAEETFRVLLSNPLGATIVDTQGTGTILDDDMSDLVCDGLYVTDGQVKAIIESGGTIYVGGEFTSAGPMTGRGVPVDAATGTAIPGYPMVDGAVTSVVSDGSGGWFIGGSFRTVGGLPRNGLARILQDNTVSPWDPNPNGAVYGLLLDGGLLYVGGMFTSIGGEYRGNAAALNPDTGVPTAWNPGANSAVYCFVVNGGTIYVGGFFTVIGNQARNRIAALDATTGAALPWNPNAGSSVQTLVLNGTTLYAGGDFTTMGGLPRNRLAAIDKGTGAITAWNPNSNSTVECLLLDGATIYACGWFSQIGGQSRDQIAALSTTTGLATSWNPNLDGSANQLLKSGTSLYVAGGFTLVGATERRYVAAIDVSTGLPTAWNPRPNDRAWAIAMADGEVYVGGSMTSINTTPRNNAAAFDAATGMLTPWNPNVQSWPGGRVSALAAGGGRVYIGGLFDEVGLSGATNLEVVDATTGARIPWSGSASGEVLALILNGGTLYAGGQFTSLGGVTRNRIGAIDAATGFATGWAPEAFGNFPDVWALALSGSTIYAGGHFDEIGGEARQNIAALDATTGLATAWNPNASGMVRALAVDGGTVYAGGSFGSIGGAGPFLAALDATTGLATSWNPDVYADIYTLAIGYGVLYAGGELGVVGNLPRQGVAEIDLVTGLATAWDPNPSVGNGYIQALAVVGSSVHVGGHFHDIAGEPRSGIACLSPADVSAVSGEEAATPEFGLSLAGGAASSVRIRYSLPEAGPVQVRVFDVQGRLLATPVDGTREAGTHEFTWDKRGSNGRLASGLYFVRLETARQKTTGRLVIAR